MFIDLTKEMEPGAFAAARDELEKEDDRERQGSAAGPEVVLPEVETDEDDLEILEGLQTSLSLRRVREMLLRQPQ